MTIPLFGGGGSGGERRDPQSRRPRARAIRRALRGRRQWMLVSLCSFCAALSVLALPLATAHADSNSLGIYSALATGWGIQPYVLNDQFQNVALDQAAPLVYVSMNGSSVGGGSSKARASYFFPGTATTAVPAANGVTVPVPPPAQAYFPGDPKSSSSSVGSFNDGIATQAGGGAQAANAADGYALAQAALGSFQFAPTIPNPPSPPGVPGAPGVPSVPSPPAVPTISGGAPTPTTGGGSGPTPTATPCTLGFLCLPGTYSPSHSGVDAAPAQLQAPQGLLPFPLPDPVEQQLTAALKAAQVANPNLLALSGGKLATTDPTLPYAQADSSSRAETRATDQGVTVSVVTRAQHVELFQGLIDFASVNTTLQGTAPGDGKAAGSGTINTAITGATIAGIPVTIDQNGVAVNDQNASASQVKSLTDQLNAALAQAGIHISLLSSTFSNATGLWQGSGGGVEVTNELSQTIPNPPAGTPSQVSGAVAEAQGTHVDFTIAEATANISASPDTSGSGDNGGSSDSGNGGGSGGGFCFFCGGGGFGGSGGSGGSSSSSTTPGSAGHGGGSFVLPMGLHGFPLLALVFVVQGLSTAAVAATAGYTDDDEKEEKPAVEEETK